MSHERPFHCIPGELWLDDEVLDAVSDDAEALFRKFADASDRDWRIRVSNADDPYAYAHSLRGRLFRGVSKNQRWNKCRIDTALRELRATGLLLLHTFEDRHWLELAPRLQYRKGENGGSSAPPAMVQGALGLGPQLELLPGGKGEKDEVRSMNYEAGNGETPRVATRRIAGRREKIRKDPESARQREGDAEEAKTPGATRGQGQGAESLGGVGTPSRPDVRGPSLRIAQDDRGGASKYARWIEDHPEDSVWKGLCLFLGREEMDANGDMWGRRMSIRRDLIETLLREVERQDGSTMENRGALFTYLFEERRKLWA